MADKAAGGDEPRRGNSGGAEGGGEPYEASRNNGRGEASGTGVSTDQIMQTGDLLLRGFIVDRMQGNSDVATAEMPEYCRQLQVPMNPSTKKLSDCLRRIGDELDGNMELQRMIDQVKSNPPKEVFFRVATEMFADGNFNWGRVVALFYFASKLVLKALCTHVPEMIRTIINWTMDYLREHVVQWIRDQGGWEGLLSYFGTPTWQTIGVFLAGVLTATVAIWRYS
ncbi:PREDICTED: apoptosis regulator BAX [Nanorana parkeri]|uniref:apoptosis regulator BAX n=1 Tax=Nanorana parkeri TaxID=125878 RepID=UPI000854B460|nr:PREDICTED: apoptosis regulator BAX [Nanorana parkeri]